MNSVELLYDFFEDHAKAAVNANRFRPVVIGTLALALGGMSNFVAQALAGRLFAFSFTLPSLGLAVLWEIALGFVLTAVLHLILEFSNVKGSAAALFVLLGFSSIVWSLAIPLLLIFRLLRPESVLAPSLVFMLVGFLVLGFKARSLRDNYHIGSAQAWVTLLMPYFAVFVAAVMMFSFAIWSAITQLIKMVG